MKSTDTLESNQITYGDLVDSIYRELTFPFWASLAEFEELSKSPSLKSFCPQSRTEICEAYLESLQDLQSPNPSNYSLSIGKIVTDRLGLTVDIRKLCKYFSEISDTETIQVNDKSDLEAIAFVNAVEHSIVNVKEASDNLLAGQGFEFEDSYIIDGSENPIIHFKLKKLNEIALGNLRSLKTSFDEMANSGLVARQEYIEDEIREFSRLYITGSNQGGWGYLSLRMGISSEEVGKLYQLRSEIMTGEYFRIIARNEDSTLDLIGLSFAIRDYISFLQDASGVHVPTSYKITAVNQSLEADDDITEFAETGLPYDCKPETARAYFKGLSTKGKNGKIILSPEEVEFLLAAELAGFGSTTENKILHPNCNKSVIRYFIYQFVYNFCHRKDYPAYRNMMIRRFSKFRNDNPNTLKRNFAAKPKKYPDHLILK